MIVEEGEHVLKDGVVIQAGKIQGNANYQSIKFTTEVVAEYIMAPVVFTQITTQIGAIIQNTRVQFVTTTNFEVKINSEKEDDGQEEICWVSWGASEDPSSNWYNAFSGDTINQNGEELLFHNDNDDKPYFFAAL